MITEDFVSFETAKLLKEKGFEGFSIINIFDEDAVNAYIKKLKEKHLPYSSDDPKLKEFYYTKPTLQMAMKWLREVHKLYIEITPSSKTNEFIVDSYRIDIVTKTFDTIYVSSGYDTYEQACEAAIKYCLENLI